MYTYDIRSDSHLLHPVSGAVYRSEDRSAGDLLAQILEEQRMTRTNLGTPKKHIKL